MIGSFHIAARPMHRSIWLSLLLLMIFCDSIALADADLMIIGTRFRTPEADQAKHVADFLKAGKPVIGIRTATHAFKGSGNFDGLSFNDFGLKVLGETWVNHHGKHKKEGARGVIESAQSSHPILRGVKDVFGPSDVYSVTHLTPSDTILMRGAVTESLDPSSPEWPFRDKPKQKTTFLFQPNERIALVGGSLAERMNLFGDFESLLHTRVPELHLQVRNFGWPADEVGLQQRPDNYTKIDDPMDIFGPQLFICFWGFNEHCCLEPPSEKRRRSSKRTSTFARR